MTENKKETPSRQMDEHEVDRLIACFGVKPSAHTCNRLYDFLSGQQERNLNYEERLAKREAKVNSHQKKINRLTLNLFR